jgi:hypothetical protein
MLAQKSPDKEMILKIDMIIIISLDFYFILWMAYITIMVYIAHSYRIRQAISINIENARSQNKIRDFKIKCVMDTLRSNTVSIIIITIIIVIFRICIRTSFWISDLENFFLKDSSSLSYPTLKDLFLF